MPLLFTLLVGWILCGIEMDIFVPSLPEIQDLYNLSTFRVEWTVAVSCIAHFLTAVIMGSLADKWGYRPMILAGAVAFVAGGIICVSANNFEQLLVGRFFQGMGNASTTTISYLVLTNIYSIEKQQQILGVLNGVIVSSMTAAPVIGSYLALFFGWRGSFTLLCIISIINLLLCYRFIPYHAPHVKDSISIREYKKIFKSKKTLYYILSIGFLVSPYYIFVAMAPILYIDSYGVSLRHFGFYQGSICLIFAIFSFGNGWIIKKLGTRIPVYFSLFCYVIYIIITLSILIFRVEAPLIITISMLVQAIAAVVPCNILYPLMFEILPEAKGKTSAILASVKMLTLSIGVEFASFLYNGTFLMIGLTMLIAGMMSLIFLFKILFQENEIAKLH